MKRFVQWLGWAGLGWLGWTALHAQDSNIDHRVHFDDFGVGETVVRLDPAGVDLPGGTVVQTGPATASPKNFLARKPFDGNPPGTDPDPLVLAFDQPQSVVGFTVGDNGGKSRRLTVSAFDGKNATKPVALFNVELQGQAGVTTPVRICRLLERDIVRIEIHSPDGAVEALDDLSLSRHPEGATARIHFDDQPPGTLIVSQYPGVRFPDAPEIRDTGLFGVGVRSGDQALIQRFSGETDSRPLVFTLDPPQGAVRVHVGYPVAEDNGGPLRVVFRAYGGSPKAPVLAGEQEVSLDPGTPIRIPLDVCRQELDIHRVEVWYDRTIAGYEVIDDLEFGPRRPAVVPPDNTPPTVLIESPQDGERFAQPGPQPEYNTRTVTVTGRILDAGSVASARLEVVPEDGSAPLIDANFRTSLSGAASPHSFNVPVLLRYGTNTVRISAVDNAGNAATNEVRVVYSGPPPIRGLSASPTLVYPQITFREASPTGPFLGAPDPIVQLTTENLHPYSRVYLIPEGAAVLPPSAPDLIEAEVVSRDPDGTGVRVRVPGWAFNRPGRHVWLIWDLWSRPGMIPWTRAGEIELRQWPVPALWSLGFMNRDETNGIAEFEGVFGNDIAPGFLETTSDLGGCARGTSAVSFFLDTFDPGMNGAPGSCYGFAALTQILASGWYPSSRFDPAVRYPTGFRGPDNLLFTGAGCTPQVPLSLWAHVQTYYGVQYSFEELMAWNEQLELDGERWIGDPVGVANEIRGAESMYLIGMAPRGMTAGHAVAPYRVEDRDANTIRIWVMDSNAPYDVSRPESDLVNQIALHRFIDIDRRSNTYRFSVGASTNAAAEYQDPAGRVFTGQGIAFTRLSVFASPRSIPGVGAAIRYFFSITGDADPHVAIEGKGEFGWKPDGSLVSTLRGIAPFAGYSFAGDAVRQPVLLLPTNEPVIRVTAQARGPKYRFRHAGGGVTLGLHRLDAEPGSGDVFEVVGRDGVSHGFRFTPASKALTFTPAAIATDAKTFETAVQWVGLRLEAGEPVAFSIEPDGRRLALRNDTERPLHFGAVLRTARSGLKESHRRFYGPFDLEAGATLQIDLSDKPADFTVLASVDADGDGKADGSRFVPGLAVDLAEGDKNDCNANRVLDLLDILLGQEADLDGNGIPDGCPANGGGSGGTGTEPCPDPGVRQVKLDVLPDGPAPARLDAITTLGRDAHVAAGVLSPAVAPGATNDPDGLEFHFRCPRGFVRLDLRLPSGPTPPKPGARVSATVLAFTSLDATKPAHRVTRVLTADGPNWFEVVAPLDQDIVRVEAHADGELAEAVAGLEHGTYVNPVITRIGFDDLAPGTRVEFQYRGLRVVDNAAVTTEAFLGTATASGSQALRRVSDAMPDLQAVRFRLSPPQLAVRVHVGFPPVEDTRSPLRVILRGHDVKGRLLVSATNRFVRATAIRSPLGIAVSGEDRIASFSLEHVPEATDTTSQHPGLEVVDDVVFGPFEPGAANDRVAPLITLTSPTPDPVVLSDPAATTRDVTIQGLVRESNGIAGFTAGLVDPATGGVTELVGFESALAGAAPSYNFNHGLRLGLGEVDLRLTAEDYLGNRGEVTVRLTTLPFPPVQVDETPISSAASHLIRDTVFAGGRHPLGNFETAFGTSTLFGLGAFDGLSIERPTNQLIRGVNFHNHMRVFLAPTNAVPGAEPASWNQAAFVPVGFTVSSDATAMRVDVPLSITHQLGSRWRWILQDPVARPGAIEWTVGSDLRVLPEVTRLHALPFINQDDVVGLGMYDTVFGNTIYIQNPICDFRDPVALITYLVFKIWMDNTRGSCVGFSATSQMLRAGLLEPERFFPNAHEAAGMYPADLRFGQFPLPEVHDNPTCGPRTPANLWAFIRGMQGVQTSSEFIGPWLSQLHDDGFGSLGGRPNNVLARIRANPGGFVLTMVPSVGRGHAVAPYEVIDLDSRFTRIRVYDPNHPSVQVNKDPWNFRISAESQYIIVDRVQNTYQFFLSSRDGWDAPGSGELWAGNGLYALPIGIWTGARHWPLSLSGIVDLAMVPFRFGTAGEALPHVVAGTNEWGWKTDGTFVDRFPGVAVPPLVGLAGQSHSNAFVLFTQDPPAGLRIDMQSRGGDYHLATAIDQAVWNLHVRGSDAGGTDAFAPVRSGGALRGFDFTPHSDGTTLLPAIGFEPDQTNRLVLRWAGLELPAGGRLGLDADPARRESRIRNGSGRTLHPRLVIQAASPSEGLRSFALPPLELPAGGHLAVRSLDGPMSARFEVATDRDGDGRPESTVVFIAGPIADPGMPGAADLDGNGVADAVDIASGDAADANGNGIPDAIETGLLRPVLSLMQVDPASGNVRIRVSDAGTGTLVLERSADLRKWDKVGEAEPVDGAVEFNDGPGATEAFYRVLRR